MSQLMVALVIMFLISHLKALNAYAKITTPFRLKTFCSRNENGLSKKPPFFANFYEQRKHTNLVLAHL